MLLTTLGIAVPFFALVLCGFAATHARVMPRESIAGLNVFVLYLALPCMLFRFAAGTPIARLLDAGTVATYLACALLMVVLTIAWTRRNAIGWNDASFGALVAAFPNSGFMGVPLLVGMLGPDAAGPSIVTLAVDLLLTSSLCIAASRLDHGGERGALSALGQALRGIIVNPLPWAILLGSLASALDAGLPAPVDATVTMLAQAASPVALFALGCTLARSLERTRALSMADRARSDVGLIVATKLVLHPLLVLLAGRAAIHAGLPLDPYQAMVLVLVAALPSASNVPILAERFGADAGRLARIVMVSTALAFVSFSLVVVGVVPAKLLQPRVAASPSPASPSAVPPMAPR